MLDYTIDKYIVEYLSKHSAGYTEVSFGTEEDAIEFIKDCRDRRGWTEYKLTKISNAIIDF